MSTKTFGLGPVLTVTTGRLLCDIGDLYEILNHMTGDDLMTHQLPRASKTCEGPLLAQFPKLADVRVPDFTGDDNETKKKGVLAWLRHQEIIWGTEFEVEPLESWEHKNPLTELFEMRGGKDDDTILVVAPDSTEGPR